MVTMPEDLLPTPADKPGYATTEFWLSLAAIVVSAVAPYLQKESLAGQIVSVIGAVLAALGYSASRAKVKAEAAKLTHERLQLAVMNVRYNRAPDGNAQ